MKENEWINALYRSLVFIHHDIDKMSYEFLIWYKQYGQ